MMPRHGSLPVNPLIVQINYYIILPNIALAYIGFVLSVYAIYLPLTLFLTNFRVFFISPSLLSYHAQT